MIINSITVDAQGNVIAIYRGNGNPSLNRVVKSGPCPNKDMSKAQSISTFESGGNFFPPTGAESIMTLVNDANSTPFVKEFGNAPIVIPENGYFYMGAISVTPELRFLIEFEES